MGPGRLGHPGRRVDGHRAGAAGHPAHPGRALPALGPRLAGGLGRPAVRGAGHARRRPRRPARQLAGVRARRGPGRARQEARRGARRLRRADGRAAVRVLRRALQRATGARARSRRCRSSALIRRSGASGCSVPGPHPPALARAGRALAGRLPRGRRGHPREPRVAPHPRVAARDRRPHRVAARRRRPGHGRATTWWSRATATATSARCARRCSSGPTPAPPGGSSRGGTSPTPPRVAPRPVVASRSARADDAGCRGARRDRGRRRARWSSCAA